ncbi:MAG: hypothetical protein JWO60_3421 [Frankiales bacterium]|nr:hypothetical protein [Frankiales bacterium]
MTGARHLWDGFMAGDAWWHTGGLDKPFHNEEWEALARVTVDDVSRQHKDKHGSHDHPWCSHCDQRLDREEYGTDSPFQDAVEHAVWRVRTHMARQKGSVHIDSKMRAHGDSAPVATAGGRVMSGGAFILDAPVDVPAVWGSGDQVLWSRGEALMIVGPPGVGKSTLAQQVLLARLGITACVLDQPIEATGSKVLYLACDRPPQIARSLHRMVKPVDRTLLDDKLVVWKGPPPVDFSKQPDALLKMCEKYGADTVVVDSLKDVAIGLSEDAVGAGYNNARQLALAAGVEVMELHHQTKRGAGGIGKPTTLADVYGSAWITAGAGSVVLLWGQAGDPVVEVSHLKQPADTVGPLQILHDHTEGASRIKTDSDPLQLLRAHREGVTAALYARLLFVPDGTRQPKDNEIEKARRKLDGLVRKGLAQRTEPLFGGPAGTTAATYLAAP